MKAARLVLFQLIFAISVFSQQRITGFVFDQESGSPIDLASVVTEKGLGLITDSTGKFSFLIRNQNKVKDILLITAVGYHYKKITIQELLADQKIFLERDNKELEDVKIFTSIKGDHRRVGYYRVWNEKMKGGEIGYIFDIPVNKFLLGTVQIKINHNYNNCTLRLHVRDIESTGLRLPENEVLKKAVFINTSEKFGLVEFDANWEEIQLTDSKFYIGFELMGCDTSTSSTPSFFLWVMRKEIIILKNRNN